MSLTKHFSLDELTRSQYATRHGINNVPTDPDIMANLAVLAQGLERVRSIIDQPITVTSGYRSPKVNAGVGGSRTSSHMKGLAADIVVRNYSPLALCKIIESEKDFIGFSQLIQEYGQWTHIAFPDPEETPKFQVMTAIRTPKGTVYQTGLA